VNRQGNFIVRYPKGDDFVYYKIKTDGKVEYIAGDRVEFKLSGDGKPGKETAVVLKVIKKEIKFVTGRFEAGSYYGTVIPDSRSLKKEIYISSRFMENAKPGDKVLCEIINYEDIENRNVELEGKIIEVLGRAGEADAEIKSVMRKYGLVKEFPEPVLEEADKITTEIKTDDRLDIRDKAVFTIDPVDAKDFDDAVSIEKLDNGNFMLGVHIADVSHYVKENSELDIEALKRGTSVYLVNEVVPMLPERLSNHICSLRPHEDKYTFSVFIELDKKYKVVKYDIKKTIINSKRRFSYEEAQEVIETKKGDFKKEIALMYRLSKNLTKLRMKEGSLDFDSQEVKFVLDEKGKVQAIKVKHRLDSMRLIEEFMLLANKCVTEYVTKKKREDKIDYPYVYRVHDDPDMEKLNNLSEFVKQFGYNVKINTPRPDKKQIKLLLEEIKGKPEEYIINDLLIRSMAKAVYTDKNIGHYGLGFDDYTHFTSPIRRYPDLIVHRILYDYLREENLQKKVTHYKRILSGICKQSSEREQNAVYAERELIKIKQIEYMARHVGDEFDGIISGIVTHGLFVEIMDILVEGMVRFRDIEDDYYEYDERNHRAVGRRHGKVFRAGDRIRIKLLKVNMENKKIDFVLAEDEGESSSPGEGGYQEEYKPQFKTSIRKRPRGAKEPKQKQKQQKPKEKHRGKRRGRR
jgi:ribonuclease R